MEYLSGISASKGKELSPAWLYALNVAIQLIKIPASTTKPLPDALEAILDIPYLAKAQHIHSGGWRYIEIEA